MCSCGWGQCRKSWCSPSSGDGPPPESIRIIASRGPPSAVGGFHRGLDDHQATPARLLALRGLGRGRLRKPPHGLRRDAPPTRPVLVPFGADGAHQAQRGPGARKDLDHPRPALYLPVYALLHAVGAYAPPVFGGEV